jgi:hypothetical protein
MDPLMHHAKEGGILLFSGAGISVSPPSCLPNWWEFNEAVLRSLADSVAAYTTPALGQWMLSELLAKRSAGTQFAPDYMADIIAETSLRAGELAVAKTNVERARIVSNECANKWGLAVCDALEQEIARRGAAAE